LLFAMLLALTPTAPTQTPTTQPPAAAAGIQPCVPHCTIDHKEW
jgi:hypothetical protein